MALRAEELQIASPEMAGTAEVIPLHPRENEGFLLAEPFPAPVKKHVEGLGGIIHHNRDPLAGRADNWFGIELDGFVHGVRVTEPVAGQDLGINLVHLPGFTEVIESGPGRAIHDRFAVELPGFRVISIASDGVGNTGEKLTVENMWDHGVEAMAEERYKLLQALCADMPLIIQGVSMGSVETYGILDRDIRNGHNLNAYALNFDTALVTPDNVMTDMIGMFTPSMVIDTPREFVYMSIRYGVKAALGRVMMSPSHLRGNILPSIVEVNDLRKGTRYERIERVAKNVGTTTISGQLDPLAQFRMWRHIKQDVGGLHIARVAGRGHGMVADGAAAADKMIHVMNRYEIPEGLVA